MNTSKAHMVCHFPIPHLLLTHFSTDFRAWQWWSPVSVSTIFVAEFVLSHGCCATAWLECCACLDSSYCSLCPKCSSLCQSVLLKMGFEGCVSFSIIKGFKILLKDSVVLVTLILRYSCSDRAPQHLADRLCSFLL